MRVCRAWLAKKKAAGGFVGESVESVTFKIARLQKINFLLESMKGVRSAPPFLRNRLTLFQNQQYIVKEGDIPEPTAGNEAPTLDATKQQIAKTYYEAQFNYRKACGD
jgi:hypothetical protein